MEKTKKIPVKIKLRTKEGKTILLKGTKCVPAKSGKKIPKRR